MTHPGAQHHKQVGPKPGSAMDRIVTALLDNPMSEKEILATVGLLYHKPSEQRKAISRSINAGWFEDRAGKYTLSGWLAELITERDGDKQESAPVVITPPVYHPPFKPLRDMYAGVREKVRDASFVSCSGVPSKVWGGV